MNNKQHIDRFIQEKVKDFNPPFDEKNWDKIASSLSKYGLPAGRKLFRKKLIAVAAFLTMLSLSLWWINYCSNNPSIISKNNSSQNLSAEPTGKKVTAFKNKKTVTQKPISTSGIAKSHTFKTPNDITGIKQDNNNRGIISNNEIKNQSPGGFIYNNKKPEIELTQFNDSNLLRTGNVMVNYQANETIDTLSTIETIEPEINIKNTSEEVSNKSKKKKRNLKIDPVWNAGAYIASDFYVLGTTSSFEGYSIFDKKPFQLSPGIIISRQTGRTYHLSAGLFYISKEYRINYNGIGNPVSAEIPLFSDYSFSFLEIPLTGSYDYLITDFLSLYLSAGLVNQIMISDKISTAYTSPNSQLNPFNDTKKYKISMLISAGMNYTLSRSLQLDFQPSVRVNLNSGLLSGTTLKHDLIEVRKIFPGGYIGLKYIF